MTLISVENKVYVFYSNSHNVYEKILEQTTLALRHSIGYDLEYADAVRHMVEDEIKFG